MKKAIIIALLLMSVTSLASKAAVNAGISVSNAGTSFYLSIGDYFAVPQREVIVVRDRHIPDEEIPVVFYLARQAKVAPSAIIELRLKGLSWLDISLHYGFGPEIFYVPVRANANYGPPYGHAYGYYNHRPRKDWRKIKLGDEDIVNLVNLKFISEHYNYAPDKIMKMRQGNKGFYAINDDIENQRKANRKRAEAASNEKAKSAPVYGNKHNADNQQMKNDNAYGKQKQSSKNSDQSKGNKKQGEKGNKPSNNKHGNNGKNHR